MQGIDTQRQSMAMNNRATAEQGSEQPSDGMAQRRCAQQRQGKA
nr:MAG TPA: hypothetical protein [Caudoviricetes sp.]